MKKIVCLVLSLVMLLAVMSACKPEEHVHTFDTMWDMDETDHWHPATCEHTDEVSDKEAHMDEDGNDLCDVCGYAMNHDHTHATEWSFNKDEHYHAPTCGCNANDKKYQKDNAPHVDENNDAICDVCTYDYDHSHTYGEDWVKADETYHWHAPTCGHDVDGADKEEHKDEDNNGLCDGCEWNFDHEHTFEEEWTTDADYHWQKPTCGHEVLGQKNPHRDTDGDGKCDGCEQTFEHYHDIDWDVWTSDKDNHWHAAKGDCAECKDAEGNAIVADFGAHTEWKEDGICDVCEHIVFHLYKIDVTVPEHVGVVNDKGGPILDAEGNPIELPFIVKEGNSLEFYLSVPGTHRLEGVEGAEVDMVNYIEIKQEDGSPLYLYKVTITPESDVTIKPVVNKLSSVEVLEKETLTLVAEKSWTKLTGTVSVTIPESGNYTMFCVNDKWMKFSNPNTGVLDSSITFYAEAGELAVAYEYFTMSKGELNLEYVLLRTDATFVLPYLKGEGYTMPTNTKVTFQFTLPEPGLYLFTTESGELTWVTPDNSDGTVEPQFFECTYAGQQFSHTCWMQTDASATFDFDWNIIKLSVAGSLGVGDNTVSVEHNNYIGYTFTAPYTGDYVFNYPDNMYMQACEVRYGADKHMYTYRDAFLQAGQTLTLYSAVNVYAQEVPTENFSGTVTVVYQGYKPAVDGSGNPTLHPYASWKYTAKASGYYTFSVPEGAQITLDGGTTWYSGNNCKAVLLKNQAVTMMVKTESGSTAKVTISCMKFEHTVTVGTADYSFMPGNDYAVTLTGFVSPTEKMPAVLTWDDANIVVTYNGAEVQSGVEFEYVPDTQVTVRYNGTATADITLTLSEAYEAPPADLALTLGSNQVVVPGGPFGKEMVFTATKAGTYVLEAGYDEYNAKIFVNGEEVELPYTFTLKQGETQVIKVAPANNMSDTIDLNILDKGQLDQEILLEMLNGIYVYKNEFGETYYELIFAPSYFDDINLVVTDSYMADYSNIDGSYSVVVENGVVKIYQLEGGQYVSVETFSLYCNEDGKLVLKLSERIEYVLEPDTGMGGGDTNNTELVIGENAFDVPAGYDGINITFTAPADGTYVLSAAAGETNYFIGYDYTSYSYGSDEDLPLTFELTAGQVIEINLTTYSLEADEINLIISGGAGSEQLPAGPVGEHEVFVESNWWGATLTLTGGQEGAIYTIRAADGDTRAMLMDENYEEIPMPYEFVLGAGQTIDLMVNARNAEGVSVRFVVEKTDKPYHEHTFSDVWSFDANAHWYAATCEHSDEKQDLAAHDDFLVDGYCDICNYKMYDVVDVTLELPDGAYTFTGDSFSVAVGSSESITVVMPATYNVSTLKLEGAELSGEPYVMYGELYVPIVANNITEDLTIKVQIEGTKVENPVFASGEVTLDATNAGYYVYVTSPITFQAEPGTYVVSGSSGALFSLYSDAASAASSLTIEVEEAGEITVYACYRYTGWGAAVKTFTYDVSKQEIFELPGMSGSGMMIPNGKDVEVSVVIDYPGIYYITAGNTKINGKNALLVETTQENEVVTFVLRNSAQGSADKYLPLSWNIALIGDMGSLSVGDNWVFPEYQYLAYYTFTAKDAGSYLFSLTDGEMADLFDLKELSLTSLGDSYVVYLEQGESVTVYLKATEMDAYVMDTLRVDFLSNYVTQNDDGSYTVVAAKNVVNSWIAPSTGYFKFEINGGTMTVDGEGWYQTYAEMQLEEGQIVYFMASSNDGGNSVTMNVEKLVFEGTVTEGSNTLNLRPNIEYTVRVNGVSTYLISWDANLDITVTDNKGNAITNGSVAKSTRIYVTLNGSAEQAVAFTIEEREPVELEWAAAGTYTLDMDAGREYVVYLPYWYGNTGDLEYMLTWENAKVSILAGYEEIIVTSGEKWQTYNNFVAIICTEDASVDFVLERPAAEEPDPDQGGTSGDKQEVFVGSNTVDIPGDDTTVVFNATMAGTYTFTANRGDLYVDGHLVANPYTVTLGPGESIEIMVEYWWGDSDELTITRA